jgi:hypothetical protein
MVVGRTGGRVKYIIKLLLWIGFITRRQNGSIDWPFDVPPRCMFRYEDGRIFSGWRAYAGMTKWRPYLFRNKPGVIKWLPGRLLPRRWGIGWAGFEFGDRG